MFHTSWFDVDLVLPIKAYINKNLI